MKRTGEDLVSGGSDLLYSLSKIENAVFVAFLTNLKIFVYEVSNKILLSYVSTHFTFLTQIHIRPQTGLQFFTQVLKF